MAVYKCTVIDNGKKRVFNNEANSKTEISQMLRASGQTVISVEEANSSKDLAFGGPRKFKVKELAIFCRQLNAMLQAGLPVANCLELLCEQATNKKFKEVLLRIYDNIQQGYTLSEAVKVEEAFFPEIFVHMVEAGEVSGNLDLVMERLAIGFEKDAKVSSKIQNAMVYPMVLGGLCVVVVIFMLIFVLPTFAGMYDQMGGNLPALTQVIIGASDFLINYWYIVLAVIAIIVVALKMVFKSPEVKKSFDKKKLNMPIFKGINVKGPAAKFARTMSTLMGSGVSLLQSLDITSRIVGNSYIKSLLDDCAEDIKRGQDLSTPLKNRKVFPDMLNSMVKIGENSGTLEQILEKTAEYYEDEVDDTVTKLTALMEPLMIIIMAIVVGFIVIAMVMPIFDMVNQVG